MARINTSKMLSNENFFSGGNFSEENYSVANRPIALSPMVEDRYDFSVTEDPVLLQDRQDTNERLYKIFEKAPWHDEYVDKETNLIKIPKEDTARVFFYMKENLMKQKKLTAYETVLAINEFFDFNYDFIVKKVLSPKMIAEILQDYYENMGMADRIDEIAEEPLF